MSPLLKLFGPPFMIPRERVVQDEHGDAHVLPQLRYRRPFHLIDSRYQEHDLVVHVIEVPAYRALTSGAVTSDDVLVELSKTYQPDINGIISLIRFLLPGEACVHPRASGSFAVEIQTLGDNEPAPSQVKRSYCIINLEELENALVDDDSKASIQMLEWLWSIQQVSACEYDPNPSRRWLERTSWLDEEHRIYSAAVEDSLQRIKASYRPCPL